MHLCVNRSKSPIKPGSDITTINNALIINESPSERFMNNNLSQK